MSSRRNQASVSSHDVPPLDAAGRGSTAPASEYAPGGAFAAVDDLVATPGRSGFVVVTGPNADLGALAAHLERRARAVGRDALRVGGPACDDAWHELASHLDVEPNAAPETVATRIGQALEEMVVVVHQCRPTRWGSAVADELARQSERGQGPGMPALLVVLASRWSCASPCPLLLCVDEPIGAEDLGRWWSAVAAESGDKGTRLSDLEALRSWWLAGGAPPGAESGRALRTLRDEAAELFGAVVLCRRSCSAELVEQLGSAEACEELLSAGYLAVDPCGRFIVQAGDKVASSDALARQAADALVAVDGDDPWATMRAAELYACAGDDERAYSAAVDAIGSVSDPVAREDFYRRLEGILEPLGERLGHAVLLRFAELALRRGDAERALQFARKAAARGGDCGEVMMTLGRASMARGDLQTASAALHKALDGAAEGSPRARVAVQLAELGYMAGDYDAARHQAGCALDEAGDARTRLDARNVAGKLLLATARWTEADEHFAADAAAAVCAGDVEAELRARLNRSIALAERGSSNQARALLESVLDDARRLGDRRAIGLALCNLATVATLNQEYARALELWEKAVDSMRAIGDKLRLAVQIMNLAELRLRLGLVAEAEQALRFARQACAPGLPESHATLLSFVAARIHLARGQTLQAAVDIEEAILAADRSNNGAKLGQCHRLAARIALEDGDLERAAAAIERAREQGGRPNAEADIAVLDAMWRRSAGRDFGEEAAVALARARAADDTERTREAHELSNHAACAAGGAATARHHLRQAVALRNQLATALPEPLRSRFLARPDLRELAKQEAHQEKSDRRSAERHVRSKLTQRSAQRRQQSLVGQATAMGALRATIRKVASNDATVLIRGESGTGKELVADAIHQASPRRRGPLVKVNCGALVETLLLSELFGHERGAFTGATSRRRGRFEHASGGTLFLDEIGDISARTQVALLRVLQDKTFERVGGTSSIRCDVRIICATNQDLEEMVARGEFREDLYYRLCGVTLDVPPLRERLDDLPVLAEALLRRIADEQGGPVKRLSAAAAGLLDRHHWPGNVRELENALRTAALFADGELLEEEHFFDNVASLRDLQLEAERQSSVRLGPATGGCSAEAGGPLDPVEAVYDRVREGVSLRDLKRELEYACIVRALAETKGNITQAAALLGMKRPRLSQLVHQHGLKSEGGRS